MASEELFQVLYYIGETGKSKYGPGMGIALGNFPLIKDEVQSNLSENKISDSKYLKDGVIIEIPYTHNEQISSNPGEIGLRAISDSNKKLSKLLKKLDIPFNKKVVSPYDSELKLGV